MTIKELIKELQSFNENRTVKLQVNTKNDDRDLKDIDVGGIFPETSEIMLIYGNEC